MAFVNYNAWAEVVCTPVEFVYKIPDDMSFSEAAAFPMNFVTAYMMLFEVANLREGMSVLVHSAGGGVVSWNFSYFPVIPWLKRARYCFWFGLIPDMPIWGVVMSRNSIKTLMQMVGRSFWWNKNAMTIDST